MKLLFQVQQSFLAEFGGGRGTHTHHSCLHTSVPMLFPTPCLLGLMGNAPTLSSFESYPTHQVPLGPISSGNVYLPASSQAVRPPPNKNKLCLQHSAWFLNAYPMNNTKLYILYPVSPTRMQDSSLKYPYVPPRALK